MTAEMENVMMEMGWSETEQIVFGFSIFDTPPKTKEMGLAFGMAEPHRFGSNFGCAGSDT
jgi:hypothetical protein